MDTSALLTQARAYELAGSLRHADAAYNALIVAATRQQDHATLAAAFRHRAVLAHHSGDTVRARSALQQSYAVATMISNRRLTAETLNTLGGSSWRPGTWRRRRRRCWRRRRWRAKEPAILARVEQNLGIVANIRGQHEAAEAHYRRSLAAYEALPDSHGSAIAHHNLGMVAADRRRFPGGDRTSTPARSWRDTSRGRSTSGLALPAQPGGGPAGDEAAGAMRGGTWRRRSGASRRWGRISTRRTCTGCWRCATGRRGWWGRRRRGCYRRGSWREITGARLTEAEVTRELGRLYVETGRAPEAHAVLREAAEGFGGLGAVSEAEATERELLEIKEAS